MTFFNDMDKRHVRDSIKMFWAFVFSPIYLPHFLCYCLSSHNNRQLIKSDLVATKNKSIPIINYYN